MNPTRYAVGQQVYVTRQNYQNAHNSNRSIHAYPSDRFVNIVHELMTKGMTGTVQRLYLPGYEVNVQFTDGTVLQMKDHWITDLTDYDAVNFIQ